MMKTLILTFLLGILNLTDFDKIAKINELKAQAEQAFKAKNYSVAIKKYTELVNDFEVKEDEVVLNLAHAYYQSNDTSAKKYYADLLQSPNKYISSVAYQQLGNLKMKSKQKSLENYKESLADFKNAIKADPKNEMARHNYEIVKKIVEKLTQEKQKQDQENKKDQKDKKDQDQDKKEDQKDQKQNQKDKQKQDQQKEQEKKEQEKKDQQQKEQEKKDQKDQKDQKKDGKKDEQKNGEQQKKEGKDGKKEKGEDGDEAEDQERKKEEQKKEATETRSKRLQEVNISPEQAKMILDAMKNNEVQYLQQNRKKGTKTDKGKPDW